MQLFEMRDSISEMNFSLQGFANNQTLDTAEDKDRELEDTVVETIQNKTQRGERLKKMKSFSDSSDYIKHSNSYSFMFLR